MAGKSDNKIIITCAITGAIHTPTMSDALPFTPDDIAAQAIGAAEAGAAILHLHARDPAGRPPDARSRGVHAVPAAHQAGDRRRHQHHDRRRPNMTVEERLAGAAACSARRCARSTWAR